MKSLKALIALAGATLILSGAAQAQTLNVGDPAPPIQVAQWVKGTPVTGFEKVKIYVVEFWATWCGPCKVSIPHLNGIHLKFKDKGLVVIGQDVFERRAAKPLDVILCDDRDHARSIGQFFR